MTSPRERARRALEAWFVKADIHGDYSGGVDAVLDEIREPGGAIYSAGYRADDHSDDLTASYPAMIDAIKRGEG